MIITKGQIETLLEHNKEFRDSQIERMYWDINDLSWGQELAIKIREGNEDNKIAQIKYLRDLSEEFTPQIWDELGLFPNPQNRLGLADAKEWVEEHSYQK